MCHEPFQKYSQCEQTLIKCKELILDLYGTNIYIVYVLVNVQDLKSVLETCFIYISTRVYCIYLLLIGHHSNYVSLYTVCTQNR